jgi:hypothetical protein
MIQPKLILPGPHGVRNETDNPGAILASSGKVF